MRRIVPVVLTLLLACDSSTGPASGWLRLSSGPFTLEFQRSDSARAGQLLSFAVLGGGRVASELVSISQPVVIRLFPDRATMDPAWRELMGAPNFQFECWMIAGAGTSTVLMLSPRAYSCNPTDSDYVSKVVTHELVHVAHRRANSDRTFASMDSAGWFVEGLAGYISGQYDAAARTQAANALRSNPNLRLNGIMSHAASYQLSASLVAHIDDLRGRELLRQLMQEPSLQDIMARIGLSEDDLLRGWKNGMN